MGGGEGGYMGGEGEMARRVNGVRVRYIGWV